MIDLTLQGIFIRAGAYGLLATVQGLSVAAMAVMLGDPGPRYDGRISLSPARHLDALGAAGFILFGLGWSKFVTIDLQRLRGRRVGMVLVVLAGVVALLASTIAFRLLMAPAITTLPVSGALAAATFLRTAAALAIGNAIFSLLPLPPLPGGHLLALAGIRIPRSWNTALGVLLLIVIAMGFADNLIAPGIAVLSSWIQDWSPR